VKGKTQAEPAAGPETAEHVPQEFVVQTETPRGSQTQTLQSCGKVEPGMHDVEEEGVVVVVVGAAVVVVVTELEESAGQVEGQNPYSPSI
jgi:hypothetical protein